MTTTIKHTAYTVILPVEEVPIREDLSGVDPLGREERELLKQVTGEQARLDYPTHRETNSKGYPVEIYDIPEADRAQVLHAVFPFADALCPRLEDTLLCIHERKAFKVRDYMVTRQNGCNYLVSPYYLQSGGTILDWVSIDMLDNLAH